MPTESAPRAVREPPPRKVFRKKCLELASKLSCRGQRQSSAYGMLQQECSNAFQPIEDEKLQQSFFNAACRGQTKYMKQVIGSNGLLTLLWTGRGRFDVNVQNLGNTTALMCAARFGHLEAMKYLLSKKADPNIADLCGKTALHYSTVAIKFKSSERVINPLIKTLLDAGANVAALDLNDMTPLEQSVSCGNCSAQYTLGAKTDADVVALQLAIKAKQDKLNVKQETFAIDEQALEEADEDEEFEEDWLSAQDEDTDVDSTESYSAHSESEVSMSPTQQDPASGPGLCASAIFDGPSQVPQPETKFSN